MKRVIALFAGIAILVLPLFMAVSSGLSHAAVADPSPSPSPEVDPIDPSPSPSPSDTEVSPSPSPSPSDTETSASPSPSPSPSETDTTPPPDTRPNVVVILADDMPKGILDAMPIVQTQIGNKGLVFQNGVIPTSLCCPSRTGLFTGDYSHTTGVYTNDADYFGAWPTFHASGYETNTLATHLDDTGYTTALIGKYMNGWNSGHAPGEIPPGYDKWASFDPDDGGDATYYDYSLYGNLADPSVHYGQSASDYSTDVLADLADQYIRDANPDKPLYLHFAPYAVHGPITPAPRDVGTWPLEPRSAIGALNEDDVSDKSPWIQNNAKVDAMEQRILLTREHETAMSLDDAASQIIQALAETDRLDNTILVFMSDNGYMLGAHRLTGKNVPYARSTNVPMMVRLPGQTGSSISSRLTTQMDITAMIADLTGVSAGWQMEGRNPLTTGRTGTVLEQVQTTKTDPHPAYCGWRTNRYMYVKYDAGQGAEFYDYDKDPNELENRIKRSAYTARVANAKAKAMQYCTPTPPGFEWSK